jgi:hypothetical protein
MDDAVDMTRRHDEILTELADLGLALARDLQARALAAKDDRTASDLALAFHRISRSLRQTLALQARLERDRKLAAREAAQDAARRTLERVQKRRREVRNALAPLIWTEAEGDEDEAEALFEALDGHLMDFGPRDEDFADQPLDACIARIRADLGLIAGNAADDDDAVVRRSSG